MGIEIEDLNLILDNIKSHCPKKNKLLIIGNAELYFEKNLYEKLCIYKNFKLKKIAEPFDVFSLGYSLGFKNVETLDINGKASLNLNLQNKLPKSQVSQYDFIIDSGVLFWCFDPGLALKNIYKMARKGGILFHICALSGHYGTGYYNIHPKLFEDFYLSNKCIYINTSYRSKPKRLRYSWSYIKRKFFPLDSIINSSHSSIYENSGKIFLSRCSKNNIFFNSKQISNEPDLIPNKVVSINVFKKTNDINPISPLNLGV